MAEVSVAGLFFPAGLLWAAVALVLVALLRRLLARLGAYRFVWHRPLFDLACYLMLFGGTVGLASWLVGP